LKILLLAVGRPGLLFRDAILEYEQRAARYWTFQVIEIKEEKAAKGTSSERVREVEAERLLERAPNGTELIALTRAGESWDSDRLAAHLQQRAVESHPGVTFLIGGAYGLGDGALRKAARQLSLSPFTLPHDLARLLLAEQLYRAGTIARGEPYHKGVKGHGSRVTGRGARE
jgi:23S rRNA (pseudouridine1915-N3)-methyltransferase